MKQTYLDELKVGDMFSFPNGNLENTYVLLEFYQHKGGYFFKYQKKPGGGKYQKLIKNRMLVIPHEKLVRE